MSLKYVISNYCFLDSYKSIILPSTVFILVLSLDFPLMNFHFSFKHPQFSENT